ncbi:MAG TPA: hypothetical protein PLZ93_10740 [Nocardioides sp.]|nr:hypothetical protein [Nocardioides sp.]HRD60752.1 hypothetical protein [Nocardioides sp.]HRI96083.1 hypothetical protein [Nocardioides sp.]HRK45421.1 hypothetical protein [Nocardioides sp.]
MGVLAGPPAIAQDFAPAQQRAVVGTLSAPDGVRWQECVLHPVTYSGIPDNAISWKVNIGAKNDIDGIGTFFVLSSVMGAQRSGTVMLHFCGAYDLGPDVSKPGRFTLTGTLEWSTTLTDHYQADLPTTSFVLAPPATEARFKVSDRRPRAGQPINLTVHGFYATPRGEWPSTQDLPLVSVASTIKVRLWGRLPGRGWEVIRGFRSELMVFGRWSAKVRWTGYPKVSYRAEILPSELLQGSMSKPVTVRTRR